MKTNRVRDMRVEREVARFMDEHLYNTSLFTRHDRTDEKEGQLKGSDIIVSIPSKGIKDAIVDEKAMCNYYYLPHSLPTFALELSFYKNDNERIEGWLTDVNKVTEYYMCIWLHAKTYNFKAEDITWLEYALVSRKKILDYLDKECNLSIERLRQDDDYIRENVTKQGPVGKDKEKDYWFFYSPQLGERPINLVVRKRVYLKLADLHGEFNL